VKVMPFDVIFGRFDSLRPGQRSTRFKTKTNKGPRSRQRYRRAVHTKFIFDAEAAVASICCAVGGVVSGGAGGLALAVLEVGAKLPAASVARTR